MSVGSFSDFEPRPGEVHFSLNCGHAGSCKERENLAGDAKGKGPSGPNRKAESTDAPERGGLLRNSEEAAVMVVERRGQVIDDESGQLATGGAEAQRKAAAFNRWHEPDDARVSSPDL